MPALLFFDIDGTLITLDEKHYMPESAKEALRLAKAKGHKLIINTGRVKAAIDKSLLEFGFDGLVCGCGTYIEYEGKEIFHHILKKEQCVRYAALLHEYGYQTVYEEKDRMFMDGEHGPGSFMEYIYNYFSKNTRYPIEDYTHPDFIFDKFTTTEFLHSNREGFLETFERDFTLIPHGESVIEAVPKYFSKATGIRQLAEFLKVPLLDCYAFGDSINDMEMLKYVPHSVAMGNAVEQVLDVVEYTTTKILEDGIANALKHYKLV